MFLTNLFVFWYILIYGFRRFWPNEKAKQFPQTFYGIYFFGLSLLLIFIGLNFPYNITVFQSISRPLVWFFILLTINTRFCTTKKTQKQPILDITSTIYIITTIKELTRCLPAFNGFLATELLASQRQSYCLALKCLLTAFRKFNYSRYRHV